MKKRTLLLVLSAAALTVFAQNGTKDKPAKKIVVPQVAVRWGSADTLASQPVSIRNFRKMMREQVVATESGWNVQGFDFVYIESRIYEDSAGNPIQVNDYLSEYCPGDTLASSIRLLLPERVKAYDTAYLSNIRLLQTNGKIGNGKPQRYVITR